MAINKRFVAASIIGIMMSFVLAPSVKAYAIEGSVSGDTKKAAIEIDAETTEEDVELSPRAIAENMNREELIKFTEEQMKGDGSTDCVFNVGEDYISIEVSFNDVAQFAELAKNNSAYKESWDNVVDGISDVTGVYYDLYKKFDMNVHLYAVDDSDRDKVLIYSCNGQKIYDIVNDGESDIEKVGR